MSKYFIPNEDRVYDNPAAEYIALLADIKRLEERKEELRAVLMSIAETPPPGYLIRVTESRSDRLESLKAIRDKSQSLFDALHAAGAVKEVVSTRLTVTSHTEDAESGTVDS
jgi:hypothetical protein